MCSDSCKSGTLWNTANPAKNYKNLQKRIKKKRPAGADRFFYWNYLRCLNFSIEGYSASLIFFPG